MGEMDTPEFEGLEDIPDDDADEAPSDEWCNSDEADEERTMARQVFFVGALISGLKGVSNKKKFEDDVWQRAREDGLFP